MTTRAFMHSAVRALATCLVASLVLIAVRGATAQEPQGSEPPAAGNEPVIEERHTAGKWSGSGSVYIYIVPDSSTYAQPTLAADYGRLHLEARYNYEALETGSAWFGPNYSLGETVSLDFTPMLGGVFGDTVGVAPGYELTLAYWKLELYSEGEYLFDTNDSSGNFAYTWSELSLSPLEWARFGLVAQRTRAYETDVDIQRGLLLGLSYKWLGFTTYVFNLDRSKQTVVLSLEASF